MACASDESGRYEAYVRPFPDANTGKWQIYGGGGISPVWTRDGRELLYRNDEEAMAVSVKTLPGFSYDTPRLLFRGAYEATGTANMHSWDISPDGKRPLKIKAPGINVSSAGGPRKINIVLNWLEEMKGRVPVK